MVSSSQGERYPMTVRGYEALKQELLQLKSVERPRNVADIEEARSHGDLSENAEYHAAKERQGFLAARIGELETKISAAQVIDPTTLSGDRVKFGATVSVLDLDTDEEVTYQIVGEDEANAERGSISIKSPIARALIGKEEGDEVKVQTPKGVRMMEIQTVEYK
ncbi:MAG: transcription elongation factor GreA [Pseudomonadota bacterium]